jgi:hypothetical protein
MFDFVSTKPDGDQWTLRFRGTGLWVAYSIDDKSDELGTLTLTDKESKKLWRLIDALALERRKEGSANHKSGTVLMRLREPTAEEHELLTAYVPRNTEEQAVLTLAEYLQDLVAKHSKERPNF